MTTSGGVLFSVVSFLTVVSFFAVVVNIMMKSEDCTGPSHWSTSRCPLKQRSVVCFRAEIKECFFFWLEKLINGIFLSTVVIPTGFFFPMRPSVDVLR